MRKIRIAFWILGGTIVWYLVHDLEYCLNVTLGDILGDITSLYESPIYAGLSLLINLLHYGSILWILVSLWLRVKHLSSEAN